MRKHLAPSKRDVKPHARSSQPALPGCIACAMMAHQIMHSTRRQLLSICLAMAAWPDGISTLRHAQTAAGSRNPRFETLDVDTAAEVEALAAQIIPSTGGPGAREAGVIYFIDRSLSTFAADGRETYRAGMAQLQQKRKELFPA